ncbi:long-chain-fatty-acid--CoA ligase [Azospirillum halopraeferens]|uniref:LuxE/PaaK family acyltransferase n=1 Tax=Azospirillum halopraeferens TaxID=34010 RepID=UPI0004276C2D|nr:long-chain-fatty-acid--CoA ligase [Azospirillum halopraeferens]
MTHAQIVEELLAFLALDDADEAAFGTMALRLFAYQFEHNAAYRRVAMQRGRTPRTVRSWQAIPAVPIAAFKELTLSCRPPEEAERVFMTSGTTRAGVRGACYHPTMAVWERSMTRTFRHRFMGGDARLPMAILFPDAAAMPNSSLAHYLAVAVREFGAADSRHLVDGSGLDVDGLVTMLETAAAAGRPLALLGASFSFVHAMDALAERGCRVALPEGSRILDTGGFKGQSRTMEADAFYDRLSATFGVPRRRCINMYGMTELSSQFYDDGNESCPSVKSGPHWVRTRVIDPLSGAEMPVGTPGVLVHHDLAHFNNVSAILTEDAGVAVAGGFLLLGRADGAEAKGCSMAVAEFLAAAQG